jgi:hypothetical protein
MDLLVPGLGVGLLGGVHVADGDNQLLNPEGVDEERVISCLTILGNASLELTGSGGNYQETTIGLK